MCAVMLLWGLICKITRCNILGICVCWPKDITQSSLISSACRCTTLCPTWVFLVGDGLALCGDRVLEDVHSILDSLPVQTNLQRVDAGRHILGQEVAWLGPQPLKEGGYLLLTQTWRSKKGERMKGRIKDKPKEWRWEDKPKQSQHVIGRLSQTVSWL